MLIEFSFENFRSIREAVTLSMVAGRGRLSPRNCVACPGEKNLRLLRCAVVYGANASGKSNLITALRAMVERVRHGLNTGPSPFLPRLSPFRLDPVTAGEPSRFEIVFTARGIRFVYGLAVRDSIVHQEWLHAWPHGRMRVVFERSTSAEVGASLNLGGDWPGAARSAAASIPDSELLLTHPAARDQPLLQIARDWFHDDLRCVGPFPDFTGELDVTTELATIDPEARKRLVDFLRLADLGISDFRIEPDGGADPSDPESAARLRRRITLIHEAVSPEGKTTEVPLDSFEEESSGTQKFFALAGAWFEALSRGTLLVVDELDLRLHPLLTRRLVELFYDEQSNPKGAQLIFTTHDSSLLNAELFRRDQIWFAEKTPEGATSLYSLADFRPRRGENFRAGYLEGRYGAIPFVGDLP